MAELSTESGLTDKELELSARVIRSAPVTTAALREAQSRLWHATHPDAVKLRQMTHDVLGD